MAQLQVRPSEDPDPAGARAIAEAVAADLVQRGVGPIDIGSVEWLLGGLDNLLVRIHLQSQAPGWPADVVARVLPGGGRSVDAEREVIVHQLCERRGFPAPRVLVAGEIEEGPYLLMPFIDAPPALALLGKPWKAGAVGRVLGDLHCRLHDLDVGASPIVVKSVDYWLGELSDVKENTVVPELSRQVDWLEAHRDWAGDARPVLCHFDLQLMNVLIDREGAPTVIDWDLAALGDPVADCAFTLEFLVLALAAVPGRFQNAMAAAVLKGVARGYASAVRHRAELPEVAVTFWRAVYCSFAAAWAAGIPVGGIRSRPEGFNEFGARVIDRAATRFRALSGSFSN